ncbi:MAG: GNAT family N-acetyltransferase, partial [Candidatus Sulfotelmatobacter sp.]
MGDAGELRLLRPADVASAFELSAQAGWNQTEDDWRMLLELAPESCWGIDTNGVLAATTTLVCYGQRLSWIGMVLTRQEFQRRGLAKRLFEKALRHAGQIGIETVKLDATEQGRPLYERFGFQSERTIERWLRVGATSMKIPTSARAMEIWREVDRERFGADRSELLGKLAARSVPFTESESYLFVRAGRLNAYVGPCLSDNSEVARKLIVECVTKTKCGWVWDLFPENGEAVKIARELGFTLQR